MELAPPVKTIEVTIDGRPVPAIAGERLIEVAERNGVSVPHFCYHNHLSVAGNCRMCLVKVEGAPKLMPACNVAVAANMKIETTSAEVQRARQNVLQFLMLNHPVDCGVCDKAGECKLQDYQFAYGAPRSTSEDPKHHKRKLYALTSRIQLDNERCILCSRCVRFTKEISKTHMLGIVERGGHAYVDRITPELGEDPYSDNVISLCPTGALLSRDFLYASRSWFLEPVRSVCTGCARGCSIDLWRRKKEWRLQKLAEFEKPIYRVTPHENPDINGPWLCNMGFDQHKQLDRPRALTPAMGGAAVSMDDAIAKARELLAGARSPAVLASAHGSNEELDALKTVLGGETIVYVREDHQPAPGEVIEDDLLIRADKNPNSAGVRARFGERRFDAAVGHDVVLLWGDCGGDCGGDCDDYAAYGEARIVHLTAYLSNSARAADVCIPISTTFERSGSFTNFEGKLNRFNAVLDKPPGVLHASDVFARLAA